MFGSIRQVNTKLMFLFLLADYILVTLAVLIFTTTWLDPIEQSTKGLVNVTLLVNLVVIGLISIGLFVKPGPVRLSDVGLNWSNLRAGVVVTLTLWISIQVITAFISLITTGQLTLSPNWSKYGITVLTGLLLAQLCGNALYEEVFYRGFLLPQLQLKFSQLKSLSHKPTWSLIAALAGSQALFALRHVPVRLYQGTFDLELLLSLGFVTILGLFFALIYIRTGNLFLAIGIHALYNDPTALFGDSDPSRLMLLVLTCLLLLTWPLFKHGQQTKPGKQSQIELLHHGV